MPLCSTKDASNLQSLHKGERDHHNPWLIDREALHTLLSLKSSPLYHGSYSTWPSGFDGKLSKGSAIPFRQPRPVDVVLLASCPPKASRSRLLCQFTAAIIALLVLLQLFSCGLFMCVAVPVTSTRIVDLRELFTEFAVFSSGSATLPQATSKAPMLIPRILHQTYRSKKLPAGMEAVRDSWRRMNGDSWQIRFYDDDACLEFVRREFPEYLAAYTSLHKDVERSDFFRYMVVLRLGGAYADIDVELKQPLDSVIRPTDTLVAGWECEVPTDADALRLHLIRKRQVLQWFFAAAPGHPVLREVCDYIAANVHRGFSVNTNRDTLERTGPGIWTDVVLRHATNKPIAQKDNPWKVRILPRVAFAVHPEGIDDLTVDSPGIVVLHHFLGSWKQRGGWFKQRTVLQMAGTLLSRLTGAHQVQAPAESIQDSGIEHFPVSTNFDPPFVMMVDLVGHGDMQSGEDVSAAITKWGTWQPALEPTRRPSLVDALVGALGPASSGAALVDVGAGQGFFSLAAAARGHRAIAFETSPASLSAFRASIKYNGFEHLATVRNVSLGAADQGACLQRLGTAGAADAADVNMRRGYGSPSVHAAASTQCAVMSIRTTLSKVLAQEGNVGALRLSANGWEGWVLEGALEWLRQTPPGVVLLEFAPELLLEAGYEQPRRLLDQLYELGYTNVAHAGPVCHTRWVNATTTLSNGLQASSGAVAATLAEQQQPSQPTWCKLKPENFHLLGDAMHGTTPENVLFIHNRHPVLLQQQQQQQQQQEEAAI